ncbi:MAG: hypothetical protein K5678_12010 [Acetatifactor sp.]|nr:hypothetical protein [Acetatifactor sp.]
MQNPKRITSITAVFLVVIGFLGGCTQKGGPVEGHFADTSELTQTTAFELLDEENLAWKDNTLDDLHAVLNLPVKGITVEGQQVGGTTVNKAGEAGCILFRMHLLGYGKDWSGVNGILQDGTEFSKKTETEEDPIINMVDGIGLVSGAKRYVAFRWMNTKDGMFRFYGLDENFQKISGIEVKLDTNHALSDLAGDAKGNYHATYSMSNGKQKYVIISPEGEVIFSANGEHRLSLRVFGDGRVALFDAEQKTNSREKHFYEANLESGKLQELDASRKIMEEQKVKSYSLWATPIDEYRILWCNYVGLLLYDAREGELRTVYQWSNHGIVPVAFDDLNIASDGSVSILYRDGDGLNYLLLKPTEEREAIHSVIFAVSPDHENAFLSAAAFFNKRYPTYNVSIQTDWDEISLLTQLGAGAGPVIVDTALTGFEELESLWQPLDGFLEQTGLADELIPEALDFGKIGDVTYGVVRDFKISTLVVAGNGRDDWNYEGFLSALENSNAAPLAYWYDGVASDHRKEYFDLLKNGLGDNYYFNAGTGEAIFGTSTFERVLRLSERAKQCPPAEDGLAIRDGAAMCEVMEVRGIQDSVNLRRRLDANEERIVGFPTCDGARNLLVAGEPIAVRSTATEEEKRIAYTFLKLVLSRESYSSIGGGYLPVRRDALEDKFENYELTVSALSQDGSATMLQMSKLDREKDVPFLNALIRGGTVQRSFPAGLQRVFDEEFGDYLAGRIDGRALDEHLKSRVWLYLEESK